MRNVELEQMADLARRVPEVKMMIGVFCDHHGATSLAHLFDMDREAFNDLLEAANDLHEQLGEE